jgi:predicted ATP-dependent endonuclease of OLD family
MLLCGIQKEVLQDGHITLFDEVEYGLEPYRIARLIKHVKGDISGQYILTTHSPTVVTELAAKDMYVVHNKAGIVQILSASDKNLEEHEIQGKLRSSADAFLAKKVVVCEGATENGLLRGFDDYMLNEGKDPFSYHGVALLDAKGGGKVKSMAKAFHSLCYDVTVLADADADDQFSQKDIQELTNLGIQVQVWNDKLSIEERAMQDLPWNSVIASVILARDEFKISVHDQVQAMFKDKLVDDPTKWLDSQKLRQAIGAVAKKKDWFKSITKGDLWFKTIIPAFKNADFLKSNLAVKLSQLWAWAENV